MSAGRTTAVLVVGAIGMLTWSLLASADSGGTIAFPTEYRAWAHVKSVVVGPQSQAFATEAGIHHIYANDKALEGYRTGAFPDGSMVVYDLLETNEVPGNIIEGAQRRIDVMVKDSQRYRATGGWDFARSSPDNRTNGSIPADRKANRVACHSKSGDYGFSEFRK
jgi:Cytochrome P460